MKKFNIMVGPSPEAKGGISAVISQYRDNDFFDRLDIVFLPTHVPGNILKKASATVFSLLKLLALLFGGKVNLIHIHTASYRSFYRKSVFAWAGFLFHRPVIFHIHGGKFIDFAQSSSPSQQRFLKRTLHKADRLISLSENSAQQLCNELGLVRTKINVIANPISLSLRKRALQRKTQRLLFLGDIKKEKGIYDLVDALAVLKESHPQLELFCGGLGDIDEINVYALGKGVSEKVHMLGWINTEQKNNEFQHADIFVLPSYAEVQPMTILEAMATGTPIVASNVGGIPEMLQHGALGCLITAGQPEQLAEAIARTLRDRDESAQKAHRATEIIQAQYSPQVICKQLADMYRALTVHSAETNH